MYRKTVQMLKLERKRKRCAAMRAAKDRIRMERTAAMRDVGGIVTDGCLGAHVVRLMAFDADEKHLAVVVDGRHRKARTLRGLVRCMARMIVARKPHKEGRCAA